MPLPKLLQLALESRNRGFSPGYAMLSPFSHVQLFVTPWTVACQAPPSRDSPGKNTGVGDHLLLQGTFLTHVSYFCIGKKVLYQQHNLGSPLVPGWGPNIQVAKRKSVGEKSGRVLLQKDREDGGARKHWRGSEGSPQGQFSSVTQSCPTLCDPMNRRTPGLPVHHQLPEFTQTHVHQVGDAIQPSHPLSSPSPPASNPSQHQSLF